MCGIGLLREVLSQCALDVARMGCLPLNAIAVIRIHCANQFSEAGSCAFVGAGGELQGTLHDIARARARLSEILLWKERLKLMRRLIESRRLPCRHLYRLLSHIAHGTTMHF